MKNFFYILGSGIMNKPFAIEILLSICLFFLFAYLLFYCYRKSKDTKKSVYCWIAILCSLLLLISFHATTFYIEKAFNEYENDITLFEKVEYQDHQFLVYKDHTVIHNPNCSCRKILTQRNHNVP